MSGYIALSMSCQKVLEFSLVEVMLNHISLEILTVHFNARSVLAGLC